jgi:hypothetical protein
VQLFQHVPGVTADWWLRASRAERDAMWEAVQQDAEWAELRRTRRGRGLR